MSNRLIDCHISSNMLYNDHMVHGDDGELGEIPPFLVGGKCSRIIVMEKNL